MDTVVSTPYDLMNRKLFSLPKLMLLPGIIMRQPLLMAQITPLIFISDFLKGRVMAFLTTNIERLRVQSKDLRSIRTKVEAFDMKNAELLQRAGDGATTFTQHRWEELTVEIQMNDFMASLLDRTKRFFNFIQHQFVFTVMVDCALAQLIAVGKIVAAEIWVFSRAIEDAVDTILMKSRAESELAKLMTEVNKLQGLADLWEQSKARALLPCRIAAPEEAHKGIIIRNLQYSRGTAAVSLL
jgi:hypothetical protein